MTRSTSSTPAQASSKGPNFVAILISFVAVSILYFNFQSTPVGADPNAFQTRSESQDDSGPPPPPLPTFANPDQTATAVSGGSPPGASVPNAATAPAKVDPNLLMTGRVALFMHLLLLENSGHKLDKIGDYTATFAKQERIDGQLSDAQEMELKVRHAPFSVYMKWLSGGDVGRQVLYVNGENDGNMIVRLGGWKRRLPPLSLDPNGSLAMKEARYPVTKAGLAELVKLAISFRQRDLEQPSGVRCEMLDNQKWEEHDCYCFTVEYDSPQVSDTYRKCITYITKTNWLPIFVKNFTWPDEGVDKNAVNLDELTLIELYSYKGIKFDQQVANAEFPRKL